MTKYTIANEHIENSLLEQFYNNAKNQYSHQDFNDLDLIFKIVCRLRDRFPAINLKGEQNPQIYIDCWVRNYCSAANNLPSERIANRKSTCTDPAIRIIVQRTQELTDTQVEHGELTHNLFMSAENIQGNLLEEYIAFNTRPYGFLWCKGSVLHAIDFCNSDGSLLLQVKNKNNTENSSSSNVREGTTIKKWYRLGTRTVKGVKKPKYRWEILNDLVSNNRSEGFDRPVCKMTEEGYELFLREKASRNTSLITNL